MGEIKKHIAELYGLDGDWDEMIFTCHNPTNTDVLFDLFNPFVALNYNVPNTPFGYVQPPVLQGLNSGTPAPPPFPPIFDYPKVNSIQTYSGFGVQTNNTLKYDSVHSRMYMTYINTGTGTWYFTWKDGINGFTNFNVPLASFNPITVVDTSISTTSNKLFILTSQGEVHIFNTNTNTLIGILVLPSFGVGTHNRIEWNSTKNSFYITVGGAVDRVYEVSAVTNLVVALMVAPVASNPFGITFNVNANQMFLTYQNSNQIARINCATNNLGVIIPVSITNKSEAIYYNPITNLVSYGSPTNSGVRTFNGTTFVFKPTVIPVTVLDISAYLIDNKVYLLESGTTNITVIDGNTLAVVENINTTTLLGSRAKIAYYALTDVMLYNINIIVAKLMATGRLTKSTPLPQFWIDGNSDYNMTIRDFFNSPAWTRRIYVYSKNEKNFKQVINHIYKDANGIEVQIPLIPNISVGVNQFQGWIAELNFPNHELVFGINQWFKNTLIEKRSELTMLLIYKQIDKSKMLSLVSPLGQNQTLCEEYASCPNTLRKWSEKDLFLSDTTQLSPYKQNMFLGQKSPAVVPFNFAVLKRLV